MVPCNYTALDGKIKTIDLDAVFDFVIGYSGKRTGWTSTVVYDPKSNAFVELRSSPQDVHGDSDDEAEEVTDQYLKTTFSLEDSQIAQMRRAPDAWKLITRR
jgi:hypothetical protein